MGLFSFFSEDKNAKIEVLKNAIENYRKCIENEKSNMARYKASNAPKHYQESGKQKIANFKRIIESHKAEIARLKTK